MQGAVAGNFTYGYFGDGGAATNASFFMPCGVSVDAYGNLFIADERNNRIRMVPTDPDTGPVERANLVKGYEVAKDQYVLFDDADFDKVKLESAKTI